MSPRRPRIEVMPLGEFVQFAEQSLAVADRADSSIEECVNAATELTTKINNIKEGKLEIRPPLALEDLRSYEAKSTTIITLGNKAASTLAETKSTERVISNDGKSSKSGTGGLGKS
jgi:hypothetical protein